MPPPASNPTPIPEQVHPLTAKMAEGLLGWRVSNFKAFGREPQTIPLAPITLIFGPNSGGKSSALHSLLFAHDAVNTGELDVHEPRLAEGAVDLGGFNQFTFTQKFDEYPISLGFTFEADRINALFRKLLGITPEVRVTHVSVSFVFAMIPSDAKWDPSPGNPALTRMDIDFDGRNVCRIGRNRDGLTTLRTLDLADPFFVHLREQYSQLFRDAGVQPTTAITRAEALFRHVFPRTVLTMDNLLPAGGYLYPEVDAGPADPAQVAPDWTRGPQEYAQDYVNQRLEEALERESPSWSAFRPGDPDYGVAVVLMDQLAGVFGQFVAAACGPLRSNLAAMTYLGPLRSFPPRDFTLTHSRDSHWNAGGGFAWDVLARDEALRARVNAWFGSDFLQTPYEFVLTDLVSGEIVSSAIESEFADIVQEKYREHEAKRGSSRSEDDEAFYFPYDAWDTDALGKRLTEKALERARPSRRTELRMIDKRTRARVSHRDVGVGLSQILPILVRAFSPNGGLHLIEQPEIHVHPALQAELGDVFINSALGPGRSRFVIETHSEHLILRILRRIRQSTNEEADYLKNGPRVRPEDIAVIYAEPTKDGTKLHHLRITPDGDFADRWPKGFFTERGVELFT